MACQFVERLRNLARLPLCFRARSFGVLRAMVLTGFIASTNLFSVATWTAFVTCNSDDTLVPISVPSNVVGTPIDLGTGFSPQAVAITPDGRKALVTSAGTNTIAVIDLTQSPLVPAYVSVGATTAGVAITPDGTKAYVTNPDSSTVTPIILATNIPGTPIPVGHGPQGIAITPDGTKAYVCNSIDGTVTPISLVNDTPGTPFSVGHNYTSIAITPDGTKAYVTGSNHDTVTPISLADDTLGDDISLLSTYTDFVAISPDGIKAYVSQYSGDVTPIIVETDTPGTSFPVEENNNSRCVISFMPDGTKAYIIGLIAGVGNVTPITVETDTPGTSVSIGNDPRGIAITPDQAPTASFTASVSPGTLTVSFNGSASSSPVGSIATYAWDFGDGRTGSSSTASHTYDSAGTYAVILTVTNTAGTSTQQTFTGQTVSNNGGPSAEFSRIVTVGSPPSIISWDALVSSQAGNSAAVSVSIPSDIPNFSTTVPYGHVMEVAISPDATRALMTCGDQLSVLNLTVTPFTATQIGSFKSLEDIAISSDGTFALATNGSQGTVSILDLSRATVAEKQRLSIGDNHPMGAAIMPDGTQALVANYAGGTVSILELGSTASVKQTLSVGFCPKYIAVTPDGTRALVTNSGDGTVSVLDMTQTPVVVSSTVSAGAGASGIAITPDGARALVSNGSNGTISVLDLTRSPIPTYTVPLANPGQIAITPDGARAYIATYGSGHNSVYVFDLSQTPISQIHAPITLAIPSGIAITPDLAPTSAFTASANGLTLSCNGSDSSSPLGSIREYHWDFGDGSSPEATPSPVISHTYEKSGPYTVALTVVNDAGTSTEVTFTGKTVSNRGLPRARSTQTITLGPKAPTSFTGKVHLKKREKKVLLTTKWSPKSNPTGLIYEIFAREEKIAVIAPGSDREMTIELQPHLFPNKISWKYKEYLHNKYSIRSVSPDGVPSPNVKLDVE